MEGQQDGDIAQNQYTRFTFLSEYKESTEKMAPSYKTNYALLKADKKMAQG